MPKNVGLNILSELSDQEIVRAILNRDKEITYLYLYKKCYPLFRAIYNRYNTNCENAIELINEIYVYLLFPNKNTGRCKLADFGFRCTLTTWLKIVAENYCYQLYKKKEVTLQEEKFLVDDRNIEKMHSIELDEKVLQMQDLNKILLMMPNKRYRELIQFKYVEERSNEDTAELMSITMSNYYNMHLRAKEQFCNILRKEGLL
ncbi:MAG: sigma-70 family RNA polymerase sigma factor [Paludibacteraceae bacterium]|nr:sigma-70 family RNA polymerase sigma factor [Paludibacteraceae bacterium]